MIKTITLAPIISALCSQLRVLIRFQILVNIFIANMRFFSF